uniref:Uncharacterized protein n=1 Tax=Anguilla anguilla TaxID=7936 RepID=A0A0E9QE30_ANGAN
MGLWYTTKLHLKNGFICLSDKYVNTTHRHARTYFDVSSQR